MDAATTTFQLKDDQIGSDEIIIAAFRTMNLQVLEEILDEDKKYEDKSKWLFLAKLKEKFEWFKEKGDTELTIKPGKCGWCNKGENGFRMTGNISGKTTSYLIIKDEKQVEIIDLIQCNTFIDEGKRNPIDDDFSNNDLYTCNPMAQLKDYLVVSEFEDFGYVIGSYDSFERAKEVSEDLSDKYYQFHNGDIQELYEKTMQYQTYKVNPTLKYQIIQNANESCSNGDYTTAIICTDREGFSLKQLIMDREQTVYLFDLDDCHKDTNRFVNFFPFLIAN